MAKIILRDWDLILVRESGEERVLFRAQGLEKTAQVRHRGTSLRIVAFSDYRVQDISALMISSNRSRGPT
jgi:hypothetical protein